jgi:hypothetical protein
VSKSLFTVKLPPKEATLEDAKKRLNLGEGEIDEDYGLVEIDPASQLYALMIDDTAAARLEGIKTVQGPFANPRIETFGPPERESSHRR